MSFAHRKAKNVVLLLLVFSTLLAFSCKKPIPPPPPVAAAPAPPPPPPAPTITLRAAPATLDRGGATTLTWEARNAATVSIDPGIGQVAGLTGNRSVNPASSVTYTATATGPGGTATDTARVTVNVPAPPPPVTAAPRPTPPPTVTMADIFKRNMLDVLFDYDKSDIRPSEVAQLQAGAAWLKQNGIVKITIEGHCDERGSEEYNLALGDKRANAVKEFLVMQGVNSTRINTLSYGEERPICRDSNEDCFERNRRAHFEMN